MKSSNKGFVWLPVLLGIFAVLAASGGTYWYMQQKSTPQTVSFSSTSTYTDSKNRFFLQYPAHFTAYRGKTTVIPAADKKIGKRCEWGRDDQGTDISFSDESSDLQNFGLLVNYGDCMEIQGWNTATPKNVRIGSNNFVKRVHVTDGSFSQQILSLWTIEHDGTTVSFVFDVNPKTPDSFIYPILSSVTFTTQ